MFVQFRPAGARALTVAVLTALVAVGTAVVALAGMQSYRSRHHFQVQFPDGWVRVPDAAARDYATAVGAITKQTPSYEAFYELAESTEHFSYPYVMIDYKDADTTEYREFQAQMQVGFKAAAAELKGRAGALLADVEFGEPVFDVARSRFYIKLQMEVAGTPVTALSCLQMGDEGIAIVNCYAKTADFGDHEFTFKSITDSCRFDRGYRHDPAKGPSILSTWWGKSIAVGLVGAVIGLLRLWAKSAAGRKGQLPLPSPAPMDAFGQATAGASRPWMDPDSIGRGPAAPAPRSTPPPAPAFGSSGGVSRAWMDPDSIGRNTPPPGRIPVKPAPQEKGPAPGTDPFGQVRKTPVTERTSGLDYFR